MGKKLGLDKSYNALKTVLGSYPITGGKFPKGSFMERRLEIGAKSGGKKYPSALTTSVNKGSKLLNVGKKVFGRTPVGKAVNLAVNVGSGFKKALKKTLTSKTNIGVSSAIVGFEAGKKTDKKMAGGMMQGYGAARTSGMGLEDQSLMPGKMVRASKGKMTKMNKGGGMDMGNTSARTTAYAKAMAKKDDNRLTRSDLAAAKLAIKNKGEDRLTQADIKMAEKFLKKNR